RAARRRRAADPHLARASHRQSRLHDRECARHVHLALGTALPKGRGRRSDGAAHARARPSDTRRRGASMTCCVPLQGGYGLPFNIVGRTNEGRFTGGGSIHYAVPGYFDTFKIPVLRGRAFNESDTASGPPVVIISEALAKQYWKDGGDPLAEQMLIGGGADNMKELATEPVRQIVGIVGDVRNGSIARDPGSMMYMPLAQMPDPLNALMQGSGPMGWVIRTSVEPGAVSKQIQDVVRETTGAPVTA